MQVQYGSTCIPRTDASFFLFGASVDFFVQTPFSTQDVGEYGGDCKFEQFKEKALVEVMCCEILAFFFFQ